MNDINFTKVYNSQYSFACSLKNNSQGNSIIPSQTRYFDSKSCNYSYVRWTRRKSGGSATKEVNIDSVSQPKNQEIPQKLV